MGNQRIPSELEAKLLVQTERDMRAIARLTHLGRHRLRTRGVARLHSIYVDTSDFTLARHRVALRLRSDAGRWEATAKWEGRVAGAVHERPELTVALNAKPRLPFVLPDGPLRARLGTLVAARPLRPILITDIHRRRFDVLAPRTAGKEQPIAELALDRVRLRAPGSGGTAAAYCEIEIERLHGARRDVVDMARVLRQRFDLTPSRDSKFARGLALLFGRKP